MAFFGDYHTHTVYSHGKATVEEIVKAAIAKGLKAVAITDHGVCNYPKNLQPGEVGRYLSDINAAREKYPEIQIFSGVEANIVSFKGTLDLTEEAQSGLDIKIFGYHQVRIPNKTGDIFTYWLMNTMRMFKNTKKLTTKNTDAYLKAMERYKVNIISHPLRGANLYLKPIGELAKELGVYIELNSKSPELEKEDLEILFETGCRFICDSDAHEPECVGDFSAADIFDEMGADRSLIANWEGFPDFNRK